MATIRTGRRFNSSNTLKKEILRLEFSRRAEVYALFGAGRISRLAWLLNAEGFAFELCPDLVSPLPKRVTGEHILFRHKNEDAGMVAELIGNAGSEGYISTGKPVPDVFLVVIHESELSPAGEILEIMKKSSGISAILQLKETDSVFQLLAYRE